MKQRLLLALLMVFASVGLAMGQSTDMPITFTIPANSTGNNYVAITVTGDQLTADSYPILRDSEETPIDATAEAGKVSFVILQTAQEQTVHFDNVENPNSAWTSSTDLAMVINGQVTEMNVTGGTTGAIATNLTSLRFENNGVLSSLKLYSNDGSTCLFPKLKELYCEGNQLDELPAKPENMLASGYQVGVQYLEAVSTLSLTGSSENDNSRNGVTIDVSSLSTYFDGATSFEFTNWKSGDVYTNVSDENSKYYFIDEDGVYYWENITCDVVCIDDKYPGVTLKDVKVTVKPALFSVRAETPTEGGSISLSNEQGTEANPIGSLIKGTTITVKVTPTEGYVLESIKTTGFNEADAEDFEANKQEDGSYQFTYTVAGKSDMTVAATFKSEAVTKITVIAAGGELTSTAVTDAEGTLVSDLDNVSGLVDGDNINITLTPKDDTQKITGVWVNSTEATPVEGNEANKYSATVKAGENTIYVAFEDGAVVTKRQNMTKGGEVTLDKTKCQVGETITITVTPNEGYEVSKVHVNNGTPLTATEGSGTYTYTTTAVSGMNAVYVEFKNVKASVSFSYDKEMGSVTRTTTGKIKEGDSFSFTVTPKEGYEVDQVKLNGSVINGDGTYTTSDIKAGRNIISVTFKDIRAWIISDYDALKGKVEIKEGSTIIDSDDLLEVGDQVTITVTPNATYEYTIKVDGQPISGNSYTIQQAGTHVVSVTFTKQMEGSFMVNAESGITVSQVEDMAAGNIYSPTGSSYSVPVGSPIKVSFTASGVEAENILAVVNGRIYEVKGASGNFYVENIVLPEDASAMNISITSLDKITVAVEGYTGGSLALTYDGTEKAVEFKTVVAFGGSTNEEVKFDDIKVMYSEDGSTGSWTTTPFTEVGTYYVRFYRAADAHFAELDFPMQYTIEKATLVVTEMPTISISDNMHVVSGGAVGYKCGDAYVSVPGEFELVNEAAEGEHTNSCAGVHVKFVASDDADDMNIDLVSNVSNLTAYCEYMYPQNKYRNNFTTINVTGDVYFSMLNSERNIEIESGDIVFMSGDMPLVIDGEYDPNAYGIYYVDEDGKDVEITSYAAATNAFTITSAMRVENAVTLKMIAKERKTLSVKDGFTLETQGIDDDDYKYDGEPKEFVLNESTLPLYYKGSKVTAANTYTGWDITYKDAEGNIVPKPIDAGEYTVELVRPADKDYEEFSITGEMVIAKGDIDDTKVGQPTASAIAKGQKLYWSNLRGAAQVAGYYDWVEDEKETVPTESNCKFTVYFHPFDPNYNVLTVGDAEVDFANNPILAIRTDFDGYVTVEDAEETGHFYFSGEEIPEDTKLIIRAVPRADFELLSLKVDDKAISNGETVQFGKKSMEIVADFGVKVPVVPDPEPSDPEIDPNSQYIVTLPSQYAVRGAIINNPGKNGVKFDDPFTFTISTASADAGKLVVKANGTTLTPSSTGVYQLPSVTSNTNITVSLANPTPLNVSVETTAKNAKGYVMGHVQVDGPSDGVCYYGDKILLAAFPEDGVSFTGWSDDKSVKDRMREIIVKTDMTIKALFSGVPTGIEDIESASILAGDGYILIKNVADANVTIVGMTGRIQAQQQISGDTQIRVPAGIYVVILENGQDVKQVKVIVR